MPEADVAAALVAVMHGDQPLVLDAEPEPVQRSFDTREQRPERGGGRKPERRPRGRTDVEMASYRIAVGKRHKVEPRQIVGALANEGGLSRGDFGHIDIRPDFSLVELPRDLPAGTLDKLSGTRISGKLIEIRLDGGPPSRRADSRGPALGRPTSGRGSRATRAEVARPRSGQSPRSGGDSDACWPMRRPASGRFGQRSEAPPVAATVECPGHAASRRPARGVRVAGSCVSPLGTPGGVRRT